MPTKSVFSAVGLAHKVCLAAEEQGYTPELLNALAEHPTLLGEFRRVQLGFSEIKPILHVIDCDTTPFIPNSWSVEEHKERGQLKLDLSKIKLHLSPNQQDGESIEGHKLRKELASKPVLNANVLDYLLACPELIPEDWKRDVNDNTRYIFFWGTIYRDAAGGLCVRCLCFHGGGWQWRDGWLGSVWYSGGPAAVLAGPLI